MSTRTFILLLLGSLCCGRAPAQPARDTLTPLLRAVDESDPALSAAEPDPSLDDPAALFRLAAGSPDDVPFGMRLADAAEAWHGRMVKDGAARFVMVGGASPDVRASARASVALAAAATAVLDRAIDAADRASDEGRPGPADDEVMRALHTRQVVLPLRAARAALVLAASADKAESRMRLAAMALESALRVESVSAWSEAERLVISGWALTLLDRGAEAAAAFGKARSAALAKDASAEVRDEALIDAALGEALAGLAARGPVTAREGLQRRLAEAPFVDDSRVDVAACLAGVDVLLRIAPLEAATFHDASARSAAMAWPWRALERVLARLEFAERGVMYAHLGSRVVASALVDDSPASSRLACAWSALAADAPRDEEAQRVLEPLADAAVPPTGAIGRDAWRLYARAAAVSEDDPTLERVCRIGLAFASCCAEDSSVGELLGFAAHAAERRLRHAPSAEKAELARDDLLAALRLLASGPIELEESSRDPWRLALGQFMLDSVRRGPLNQSLRSAGEAMTTLRLVTGNEAGLEGEALLARVWSALLRVAEDSGDEEAPIGRAAMQLLDLCDPKKSRAASSASERPDISEVMTVCRAQALVALRRPADALIELERFIGADAPGESPSLEVGIEAFLALEREAEARELASRSKSAAATLSRLSRRGWRDIAGRTDQFIAGEPPIIPAPAVAVYRLAAEFAADPDQAIMHRARLAWSLLLGGNAAEAASVFQAAHAADPASAGLRRGLGESLLGLGDEAGAFTAFSAVAQAFEARQDFSRDYWHAWTRMLEILSRRPRSPDEDARLRREIARLRSLDAALQQPDCMVRIKAVESAIGRRE